MPDSCGAQLATALFRRRNAHLLRREGLDDVVDNMETEESFSQATDMHAAMSHEHTADDAAIPLESFAYHTPQQLKQLCVCRYECDESGLMYLEQFIQKKLCDEQSRLC